MSLGSANPGWIKTLAPGVASPAPGAISLSASFTGWWDGFGKTAVNQELLRSYSFLKFGDIKLLHFHHSLHGAILLLRIVILNQLQ
jgi:hypothetical protein